MKSMGVLIMEPQPIDWEYYKKDGSKVMDMYKEAYESIEIPKYVDTGTTQYKPKFDAVLVELKEAEKASLKESERIEKEIAEMQEMKKKISSMTADEYFEKHPELKQKFDDEIRNDYCWNNSALWCGPRQNVCVCGQAASVADVCASRFRCRLIESRGQVVAG
ncbi:hypothetical protein E2562_020211 [Oryza meyeriana var. granulata]|uniref:Uncharacterized protein n=1 Tax=Oryza meyeriana var. granulata TaxID=110450 RepID=A0A6G1BKY9_9ORYZ|nr:hypothetical protein E2562_020211 [Oryza meyeriana var. granulata]